jgi:hypothetical protein
VDLNGIDFCGARLFGTIGISRGVKPKVEHDSAWLIMRNFFSM